MSRSKAAQVVISPNQCWSLWAGWKWGVELSKFHRAVGSLEEAKTSPERGAHSAAHITVKMFFLSGAEAEAGQDGNIDSKRLQRLGTGPTFKHSRICPFNSAPTLNKYQTQTFSTTLQQKGFSICYAVACQKASINFFFFCRAYTTGVFGNQVVYEIGVLIPLC